MNFRLKGIGISSSLTKVHDKTKYRTG